MNPIVRLRLDEGPVDLDFWPGAAARVQQWLAEQRVHPRELVMLLPHAGLLPPAREAFARLGGWQPRIETTRTLAASLAPNVAAAPGQISSDPATDRLSGAALLRRQATGMAWSRRDARGFDAAVAAMVSCAHTLLQGAHERPPASRGAYWAQWREALVPVTGPGASERWLARVALEWAAAADPPALDALWQQRPAAWVGLRGAGDDALMQRLLEQAAADRPVLWLDAAASPAQPFDASLCLPPPTCARAEGLEEEAAAAAIAVLEALDRDQVPVALIAQDRLIVRRIRALLERAGVALADETGWTLSTTRAAADLMATLNAAAPGAGRDALIEALKAEAPEAAAALEDAWRSQRSPNAVALAAEQALRQRLAALRGAGRRRLADWIAAQRRR